MKQMLRGLGAALGLSALVAFAAPASAYTTCGWRWSNYWQQTVWRCTTYSPSYYDYYPYYRPYYGPYYGTYYGPHYGYPYYGNRYYWPQYGYPHYGPRIHLWLGF